MSPRKQAASTAFATVLINTVFITIQSLPVALAAPECASFNESAWTIEIECDATLEDIDEGLSDNEILHGDSDEWILNANILVQDGATLIIDGGNWLKITDDYGIIVDGELKVEGVKITSWDEGEDKVIEQDSHGSQQRAFIHIRDSEGVRIKDSEFAYLGYNEPGKRGLDVFGEPSSNIEITDSEFHNMWMAFYSREASDIVIDGNEYHHNVKYALDPHTGTSDMQVTNNHLHHNPIGVICSLDCYQILIEGNEVNDNGKVGIFLSRNMHDSIVRDNELYNEEFGIVVSESPDNEIYNNEIEASDTGILLFNPEEPDDGETEGNLIRDNSIMEADFGIRAARSQGNVLESNEFFGIGSSEYQMAGSSAFEIRNQDFDNDEIAGNAGTNTVEISGSGVIEVDGDEHDTDRGAYERELSQDSIVLDSQ